MDAEGENWEVVSFCACRFGRSVDVCVFYACEQRMGHSDHGNVLYIYVKMFFVVAPACGVTT